MKSFVSVSLCILCTSLASAQWVKMTAPSGSGISYNQFCATEGPFLVGTNGLGIHMSTDNGLTWTKNADVIVSGSQNTVCMIGAKVYCGMYSTGPAVSTNNGLAWSNISTGITNKNILTFNTMGRYTFATGGAFYRSVDAGANWTAAGTGLPTNDKSGILVMGSKVLVCAVGSGVYLSTDSGATFSVSNGNLPFAYPKRIIQKGPKVFLVNGSNVMVSTDTCKTWADVSTGVPSGMEALAMYTDGSNIYIGTFGNGICYTTNEGGLWKTVNTGLTNLNVRGIIVRGTYVFAGTDAAIWRRAVIDLATSVEEKGTTTPTQFALFQNYPNPFNPNTAISFELPANSSTLNAQRSVRLSVFDLLGREVAVLIDGTLPAGTHTVEWSGAAHESGTYFCRLVVNGRTEVRKLVLAK